MANGGRDRGRPNTNWFKNRRGDWRLSISISVDMANALAVRDEDAIEKLCGKIETAVTDAEGQA